MMRSLYLLMQNSFATKFMNHMHLLASYLIAMAAAHALDYLCNHNNEITIWNKIETPVM